MKDKVKFLGGLLFVLLIVLVVIAIWFTNAFWIRLAATDLVLIGVVYVIDSSEIFYK